MVDQLLPHTQPTHVRTRKKTRYREREFKEKKMKKKKIKIKKIEKAQENPTELAGFYKVYR